MEKLIELLNEYGRQKEGVYWIDYQADMDFTNREKTLFCSKYRGWIGWLVENDKIDLGNIPPIVITKGGEETAYNEPVMIIDRVLMLLSISNSPIEDLILYLK